jgi:transglutaminase-like putative cysteine protease
VHGGVPEYDRLRRHLLTLPAVDVGSVVDWETRLTRRPRPDMPPWYRYVVSLDEPVVEGQVEVRVHRDLDMVVHLSATDRVARSRRVDGEYVVETFEYAGLEPGRAEDDRPPAAEIFPTVYVTPRQTWAEVAAPLAAAVDAAVAPGERVRKVLAQLKTGGLEPAARFEAIAAWVAREVRLVGVGMGQFSFAPRPAEEVLATGTGNYLDKTAALHALLRAADVPSRLFLVRDRYMAPLPEGEVRGLQLFDDAAVQVKLGGEWVFRDADSDDLGPADLPASFYDVHALGLDGETAGELVRLEAPPMEVDRARQVYRCFLEADGTLVGERRLQVRGNPAVTVRGYRNLDEARLAQRMIRLNHAFHPRAELLGFDLEHVDDFSRDVVYVRRFRVPRFALRAGESAMAFRLPGLVDSAADVGETTRRYPRAWQNRAQQELDIRVELPAGWRVLHLPEGFSEEGGGWSYSGGFAAAHGEVTFTSEYVRETFRVTPDAYPSFKAMRDGRARLARQWVVVEMVR